MCRHVHRLGKRIYEHVWSHMATYDHISYIMTIYDHICSFLIRDDHIWSHVFTYGIMHDQAWYAQLWSHAIPNVRSNADLWFQLRLPAVDTYEAHLLADNLGAQLVPAGALVCLPLGRPRQLETIMFQLHVCNLHCTEEVKVCCFLWASQCNT